MRLGRVLKLIGEHLERQEHPCALVGGLGLAAHGLPRATLAPDLLDGIPVLVPRPEHLAAMKILAMKNDPRRRH